MDTLPVIALVFGVPAAGALFIWCIVYYWEKHGEYQISFRMFRSLYAVAPDRWRLWIYSNLNTNPEYYRREYYKGETIYMKTFLDHLRYLRFARAELRKHLAGQNNSEMKKFASNWQQDIDEYRKAAEKELRTMSENILGS